MYDTIFKPDFEIKKIKNERGVILHEIEQQIEDNPFNYGYVKFERALKGKTRLGRSILGSRENIKIINKDKISNFYKKCYVPSNIVLSIVGDFDIKKCRNYIERTFGKEKTEKNPAFPSLNFVLPQKRRYHFAKKGLQQAYILMGSKAPTFLDEKRYAMLVVAAFLGGGMLSKLYKKLVEELGLAYNVYTYYAPEGHHMTVISSSPSNVERIIELLKSELKLACNGITEDELDFAKNYAKGHKAITEESNQEMAEYYGFLELFGLHEPDFDKKIDSITTNKANAMIRETFDIKNQMFVVVSNK